MVNRRQRGGRDPGNLENFNLEVGDGAGLGMMFSIPN